MTMYFSGPYKLCALILHEKKINEIDFILSLLDLWLFLDLNSYIPFLGCVYECFQLFLIGIIMGETGSHVILKGFVFHAVRCFFSPIRTLVCLNFFFFLERSRKTLLLSHLCIFSLIFPVLNQNVSNSNSLSLKQSPSLLLFLCHF